nr:YCII-related domain protein [uncultured bacterium]
MRFMILVKATPGTEAGVMPEEALFAKMHRYHAELAAAGLLLDASGLKPSREGWRVRYDGESSTVVDGPFVETKELVAGYTILQAATREEAIAWTRRFPNPSIDGGAAEIEVRPFYELEDFAPSEAIDGFRALQQDFVTQPRKA